MAKTKQKSNERTGKSTYHLRNWSTYNEALQQRGSLTVWLDPTALTRWYARPSGKRGAQPVYTDTAITVTLQFGKVFGQKLRQTEGFVRSLFTIMHLQLKVPDASTLCRRGKNVPVKLPKRQRESVTIIVDSTGLKVFGEGEWKVRKHGYSKRRTWRKFHLGVTPDGEIRATELTDNSVADHEAAPALLTQEAAAITMLAGDGAFDQREVYDYCQQRGIPHILIPPQRRAKIWQHGNAQAPPHPRDENLRHIRRSSRKRWKETVGYHIRSLAETAIFRFKTIFGDRLDARLLPQQRTEVLLKCAILNRMRALGMPDAYAVAV